MYERIVELALGDGEGVMSQEKTILVVGLVAEDDASTEFLSQEAFADFEEQSVYEVVMRLRTGKSLPDRLMTTVSFQDELSELVSAVTGKGIRLALMTDERKRAKPASVAELLTYLPKNAPKGDANHLFPIL
jgi:hypothetical protein